jgi:hypothetical protein
MTVTTSVGKNVRSRGVVWWMGFPHARWSQPDQIGRRLHKAQRAQLVDAPLGERRLKGEVEAV